MKGFGASITWYLGVLAGSWGLLVDLLQLKTSKLNAKSYTQPPPALRTGLWEARCAARQLLAPSVSVGSGSRVEAINPGNGGNDGTCLEMGMYLSWRERERGSKGREGEIRR